MPPSDQSRFLRFVLLTDVATCVATGFVMTLGSGVAADLTMIPRTLLTQAGVSLFPIAAFIAFLATRSLTWRTGIWLVILGNAGWAVGSLCLLIGGAIVPNGLGIFFISLQGIVVAVLGVLEFEGLRREREAGTHA